MAVRNLDDPDTEGMFHGSWTASISLVISVLEQLSWTMECNSVLLMRGSSRMAQPDKTICNLSE